MTERAAAEVLSPSYFIIKLSNSRGGVDPPDEYLQCPLGSPSKSLPFQSVFAFPGSSRLRPRSVDSWRDAVMSVWSEMEWFQHLVEAKPQRMKAVVKAKKGVQPGSRQSGTLGIDAEQ